MTNQEKIKSLPEIAWSFPEFESRSRNKKWWTWFTIIDLVIIVYAVVSANYLFALILVMISGIVVFREYHDTETITCTLTDDGIFIDEKLYNWDEIQSFWFVYQPPEIKNLYISFKSLLRPTLTIPLLDQNPLTLRQYLSQYIEEDLEKEGEPTTDALGRLLKL